jgi:hypothetical protein
MTRYASVYEVKSLGQIGYSDLGFKTDGDFESWLENVIIPVAESIIDNYCQVPATFFADGGVTFSNQLYDYRYPWIDLRYYPALSVSKVEYNTQGYGIAPSWTEITSPDYILVLERGHLMLVNKTPAIPEQSVRVSYTAGYGSTPIVVRHVCIQVCSNILHTVLQKKVSPIMRVDDWTLRLVVGEAFSKELQVMLAPFIRKVVAIG